MNLLTNRDNNIRYESEIGVILYNPTTEQFKRIKDILRENVGVKDNTYDISEEVTLSCIKYIYITLTNVGSEARNMSDLEFDNLLSKKIYEENDREVINLYREIKKICEEAIKDLQYEFDISLRQLESLAEMLETQLAVTKTSNKLNETLEKVGMNKEEFKDLLSSAISKELNK